MSANRLQTYVGRLLMAASLTVMGLMATEHHGIVKSGGLPIPGAAVTATQGDKKLVTTTDDAGYYSFPDLDDGVWTITVDMLGFAKTSKDVGVAPDAPSPQWDLKFQTLEEMTAPPPAAATPALAAPAVSAAPPTPASAAATAAVEKPAETKAAAPAAAATPAAATTAAAAATAPAANSKNAKNAKNAKNSKTPASADNGTNNGRPSLNAALATQGQGGGFTRLGVNQSTDASALGAETAPPEMEGGDLAAAGDQSFTINGSVSSGLNMPQPGGDWFGGRGGMGGDMGGMGMGPGGIPGMGGAPGDPNQAALAGAAGGRGGGRGGAGGPGGGPGGPGGGPMMMGGGGGGFGGGRGGGGFGGGGGRGGGFGGPGGGRGGRNAASFGNNRRNPRSRFNFSASAILTNSALNARQYSVTGQEVNKPNTQSLRSTLTAGGPLKIPHVLTNNKGTFTINYTLGRNRTGSTWSSLVPTPQEAQGNFAGVTNASGQQVMLYDPLTLVAGCKGSTACESPFPSSNGGAAGTVIPASRISATAQALLAFYPQPNFSGSTRYNFADSGSGAGNSDNVNARLSYTFNTKNQINGGIQWQRSNTTNPSEFAVAIPAWHDHSTANGVAANAAYIYHFSLRVIATTRFNYSRANTDATPYFANLPGGNVAGNLGILGADQYPLTWGPPSLGFSGSGILGLSDSNPSLSHPQTSAVGESVLWVRGVHEFTFGADFSRREANTISQNLPRGSFGFTGGATALNGLTSQVINGQNITSGYDLADFLLGTPDTMRLNVANSLNGAAAAQYLAAGASPAQNLQNLANTPSAGDRYLRTNVYDLYVNDQWRLTPRLSLSLGVRWDYQAPTTELYGRLATIDLPANFEIDCTLFAQYCPSASGASGLPLSVVAGQTGPVTGIKYSSSMLNGQKRDISPRLGFAWKPYAKHSTVVRGGYGLYYIPSIYSNLIGQLDAQTPFSTAFNLSNTCGATLQNGLYLPSLTQLGCAVGATTTNAIETNFRVGYSQNWQLAVQQNLLSNTVATITYFGSKGTGLTQQFYPNSFPTTNRSSSVDPSCPSGYYCPVGYLYETSNGDSTDDGVQFQLQRRLRSGFGGSVSYTLNRAFNDTDGIAQNWLDLAAEHARAAGISEQTANFQLQYSTGVGARGGGLVNGWKGQIVRDWSLMANISLASGQPININSSGDLLGGTSSGSIRADYTGQPAYLNGILNPAAFANAPAGQFGNLGRDVLNGPMQFTTSANAFRTFRLADRKNLTFMLMTTNPLNHPNVSAWNTSITSNQFGLPAAYNGMRSVQATMRFNF